MGSNPSCELGCQSGDSKHRLVPRRGPKGDRSRGIHLAHAQATSRADCPLRPEGSLSSAGKFALRPRESAKGGGSCREPCNCQPTPIGP